MGAKPRRPAGGRGAGGGRPGPERLRDELRTVRREVLELRRYGRQLIASLGSGLVIFDGAGRVIEANPPAREALDVRRGEVPGVGLAALFGEDFAVALLARLSGKAEPLARCEDAALLRSGERKTIGFSVSPLRLPKRGDGWILLFRDITEIKRLESEVRRLDRLVSLGEISANVAHELKNPLTVMYANMEWLLDRLTGEAERRRVQIVIDHMERMEGIIARMGILSKDQPLAKRAVDVAELVRQLLSFLEKTLIEKHIAVESALPALPCWVSADPAQLQQALLNIMMNALQAMGDRGRLEVELRRRGPGGARTVVLSVADDGPGIPAHLAERIFEAFFTTKEAGTGLGLAITHQIIQAHGGRIRARNRPSGGAVFRISLPAADPPA